MSMQLLMLLRVSRFGLPALEFNTGTNLKAEQDRLKIRSQHI